jgi:hypothetical protein
MTFEEWQDGMSKASETGGTLAPEALLRTIEIQAEPIRALMDMDLNNNLFASLHEEYPFFMQRLPNKGPLPVEEQVRGIGVLRWLIEQFRGWSAVADPKLARFVALVVVIQSCPWNSTAWFSLDDKLLLNAELAERLREMLAAAKIEIRVHDATGDLRAEGATVAQLKTAESIADWKALVLIWRRMSHLMGPNSLLTQAVRYLYRHDPPALVRGTAGIQSIALAQQIVNSLTVEQAFHFASQTDNRLIQLMAIETAFEKRPRLQPFSGEEERSLGLLLQRIVLDEQAWSAFLGLYNEHPSAYPPVQPVIGTLLVLAPETALDAYVQSVDLSAPCNMADRQLVAVCLAIFRNSADEARQHRLWEKAFQRWNAWSFDGVGGYLLEPTLSELDYAVIGYLKECAERNESIAELGRLETELAPLEVKWFPTITDFYTARNRLMSRLQQYAHAAHTSSEQNWLAENPSYEPPGGATLYASLRFSLKGGF